MEKVHDIFDLDAEAIIVMAEKIIHRHIELGPASPLKNLMIADLNSRISIARQKHDEATKYRKLMEDAVRERDHYIGTNQKSVQYTLQAIVGILRQENSMTTEWGLKS